MASTSTGPITDSEVEAEYNEVKYSPFHRIHGSNVVLSKDGCVARRAKGYDKAVVFSSKPIPIGNRFQVVITNMEQEWSGSLRFGVSICNPATMTRFPSSALEMYTGADHWTISGNRIYNKQREKRSLVNLDELVIGDSVGCLVTKRGKLEIFLNGESLGVGWGGLPADKLIWGFADLYGRTTEVRSNTVCDLRMEEITALRVALASSSLDTRSLLPNPPADKLDSPAQQKGEELAALRQELAAERQSMKELTRTWEMANLEFMQMQKDHEKEMKTVRQELTESRRQLMDVQSHLQQILGLHKDIPNGEGHSSLPGNIAGADSNSVHSMLDLLKERLQELLTGERGTACGGYSGVQDTVWKTRAMSLPVGVKEAVTVNSLLLQLKQKLSAGQQEEEFLRVQMQAMDKQNKTLERDISQYKVALAQFAKDREPIESAYEARYLELCEELQEYVSSFQDSMKETQSNLEGAREELTDMKRVVEMNSQPIEQVQESKDEVSFDQCPSDGKESSEGEGEGESALQEEDMTNVASEDASSGD